MAHQLHKEIASDIGLLVKRLAEFGYAPTNSHYHPLGFGNYVVDLNSETKWFRIIRDRGQYFVNSVDDEQLRKAGLYHAFDDRSAFEQALIDWLRAA